MACFGQFQYTVLPFWTSEFIQDFETYARGAQGCETFAQAYIDDIYRIIFSHSWDYHIKHLDTILERIQNAGLTVKPKKCSVGGSQIEYLDHVIGSGTIQPKDDKIQAVKEFSRPLTKKNVRAFLGLPSYYHRFISRYAAIALPLTSLTKEALPNTVCWTQECEGAFETLKDLFTSAPILIAPDFTKSFIRQTDASNIGLGAVLGQLDANGHERPIVYLNRKLLSREQNYTTSEKECLAIVWAIGKLHYYLYDDAFTVYSDHKSLVWLEIIFLPIVG